MEKVRVFFLGSYGRIQDKPAPGATVGLGSKGLIHDRYKEHIIIGALSKV